ncbi:ComF family protein [Microbulbifer celer]|uniref:ComF family protein n=1 Tax=Microbulbifer celer TaxID=435905 RepID=A0ABW3U949_9GAMM|nr:ComF family protein [Microbulbifer celer]UFN57272.1 ComF family protein [Microbulbifer celer]
MITSIARFLADSASAVSRHSGRTLNTFSRCLLCHTGTDVDCGICSACRDDLPHLGHACRLCAEPLATTTDRHCPRCLQQPPPFAHSSACWFYAYPVAQLIQHFKYHRDLVAGRTLAEVAAGPLSPTGERPDLLVPVPLHWRRQLSRGYNQAQLIAGIFGGHWQIPVDSRALRKTSATGSQQQLKRRERLRNLSRSFSVPARAQPRLQGLHIGLVDDVITTGATLEAASRTLLEAGVRIVSTYALARTP